MQNKSARSTDGTPGGRPPAGALSNSSRACPSVVSSTRTRADSSVSAGIWVLLVFYALAASMWTVWLWMTGLKSVPAAQGGIFTVMLPVSAALVGVLVLGEQLTGIQMLALGIALGSVLLATVPSRTAARVGHGPQ